MAGRIILGIANPALDANGKVDAGATMTFYHSETTTLQSIYTDPTLTTPLPNPLPCDAAGRFPQIWAPDGSTYSVKWAPLSASPITFDNIVPLSNVTDGFVTPQQFGAVGGLIDDTTALVAADAYCAARGCALTFTIAHKHTSALTLASNLRFEFGGALEPVGVQLKTNGRVDAGPWAIFKMGSGGTVAGSPIVEDAWGVEWFGGGLQIGQDDALAFNAASFWLSKANKQGVTAVGYGRARFRMRPIAYLAKTTLKFQPFVSYIGIRATTADSNADQTSLANSRGTIWRQDVSLYKATNAGVLSYLPTGDCFVSSITFVGTANINANPSVGTQYGQEASPGALDFDNGDAAQVVSGVTFEYCSWFSFRYARSFNNINDTYFRQCRDESNLVGTYFNRPSANDLEFSDHTSYACGLAHFQWNSGVTLSMRLDGGTWQTANTDGETIFSSLDGNLANITVCNTGAKFQATTGNANLSLLTMRGSGDATHKQNFLFSACEIDGLGITYVTSGSGAPGTDCAILVLDAATQFLNGKISVGGRSGLDLGCQMINSSLDLSNGGAAGAGLRPRVHASWRDYAGTAITLVANLVGGQIVDNTFNNVTTPIGAWQGGMLQTDIMHNPNYSGTAPDSCWQTLPTSSPGAGSGKLYLNAGVVTVA